MKTPASLNVRGFPLWIALLIALGLAANLYAWSTFGLLPDEAYYWVWSQRLQLSFFDHPPLVGWLIWPFTALLGDASWAIRLPAVLSWLLVCVLAYDWGRRLYGRNQAGALAVLVWASLPIVQVGFHLITPDTPLILFTWLTYYLLHRALTSRRPGWWLGVGLSTGLALLGKYPAVLVPAGVLVALLLSREGRQVLRTPWPWLGALVALAVFSPVLVWNYGNDFLSFRFQLGHGIAKSTAEPLHLFLVYAVGQLAVAMPWTLLAMAYATTPMGLRQVQALPAEKPVLVLGFWLPLLVFGAAALTTEGGPNWPITAYVPGTLLLAGVLDRWLYRGEKRLDTRPIVRGVLILASLSSLVLVGIMRYPQWLASAGFALPDERTQFSQSYGWPQVGRELEAILPQAEARNPEGDHCFVLAGRLQNAAMIAWLLRDVHRVTLVPDARISQFQLWERQHPVADQAACLYVAQFDGSPQVPSRVQLGRYGEWRLIRLLRMRNADLTLRQFGFYVPAGDGPG